MAENDERLPIGNIWDKEVRFEGTLRTFRINDIGVDPHRFSFTGNRQGLAHQGSLVFVIRQTRSALAPQD